MVISKSIIHSKTLSDWINHPEKMVNNAEFWVSAGSVEHWAWSIKYAFKYDCEQDPYDNSLYVYWGSRINVGDNENICSMFNGKGNGLKASSRILFENYIKSRPNIVLFYLTGKKGIIGAGLVVSVEEDFLEPYWPSERRSKNTEFPFRFKMRVIWLHPSVLNNPLEPEKWRGDPQPFSGPPQSGLRRIAKKDDIERVRKYILDKIRESKVLFSSLEEFKFSNIDWNFKKFEEFIRKNNLFVNDIVLKNIISAIKSGKNIILVGPPGTGKTTLARLIAKSHGLEDIICTATSDWTRIDIIGGPVYMGQKVKWRSGCLIQALARWYSGYKTLLIIDEINRANMDRIFGEFFTMFGSSNPDDWRIPASLLKEIKSFGMRNVDHNALVLLNAWYRLVNKADGLRIPSDFRIIATMNTFDRRYLFTLGYALLRRFNVIEVSNPDSNEIEKILSNYSSDDEIVDKVLEIYKDIKEKANVELGVALLIDLVRHATNLRQYEIRVKEAISESFKASIMYQFEGLDIERLKRIGKVLEDHNYSELAKALKELYPETEEAEISE